MSIEWSRAYDDKIVRQYAQYTGERPQRRNTRQLASPHAQSIHLGVRVEYCACEPSEVRPGHSWNSYGQVTAYRFRSIALDDVVFEITSSKRFDQGCMQMFFVREGQEVPMSQDELDWARYWGEQGCHVGRHPTHTWIENRDE